MFPESEEVLTIFQIPTLSSYLLYVYYKCSAGEDGHSDAQFLYVYLLENVMSFNDFYICPN